MPPHLTGWPIMFWQGYGTRGEFIHCWWECKLILPHRTVVRIIHSSWRSTDLGLRYSIPSIPNKSMSVHWEPCMKMFTYAVFIVSKMWRQLKCPWRVEWVSKLWHTYAIEYRYKKCTEYSYMDESLSML